MKSVQVRSWLGLAVLTAALGLSAPANASYTVLTAVDSVAAPGSTLVTLPNSGTFSIDSGMVTYGHGGVEIILPSGVDIYLINTLSVLNPGPIPGSPSEQIYVVAPAGSNDTSTVAFTVGYGINGSTDSFIQTGMISLGIAGGAGSFLAFGGQPSPTTYSSGGLSFTATGTSNNGDANSLAGGAVGLTVTATAVPEPASIAMLGLGLAGFAGLSAYRRRLSK